MDDPLFKVNSYLFGRKGDCLPSLPQRTNELTEHESERLRVMESGGALASHGGLSDDTAGKQGIIRMRLYQMGFSWTPGPSPEVTSFPSA